jgi:hypothetical protein
MCSVTTLWLPDIPALLPSLFASTLYSKIDLHVPFPDNEFGQPVMNTYHVIVALACNREVMVGGLPYELDRAWVLAYLKEQEDIKQQYLSTLHGEAGQLDEGQLSEAQQQQLNSKLAQGRIECNMSDNWIAYVQGKRFPKSQQNHVFCIVPHGLAQLVDNLAACKAAFQAKGARWAARTCRKACNCILACR